ncbi:fimbrial protein [Providencia sp. Me31A]|uniref:fimbrial protein n=1 Tax=Providencia sp. Me31A TaxID=3392637 RepID=UPI003D284BA8
MNIHKLIGRLSLGGLLFSLTFSVFAGNSVQINLRGNLLGSRPCDIAASDGKNTISVNFGDMVIRYITGNNFGQPVPYKITCPPGSDTTIVLSFSGTTVPGQADALATNNKDLGIRFQYSLGGTSNFARLNTKFVTFDSKNQLPVITAYPRIYNSNLSAVKTGTFTSTITLRADYP